MWVMWYYCDCSWIRLTVVIQSRSSQDTTDIVNVNCVHSSGDRKL
jgi:hypothetical protein